MSRLREGRANTARGAAHFLREIRTDVSGGTGFIVNDAGLVVTNKHVIRGANSINLRLPTQAPTATPTPEPTPTQAPPVPSPPSSPVEIGTTVEAGGSSYTLNEVKDPAPAGVFGVDAGKRLVALDITQVGISDDGDPYNPRYFAVQDTDGYVYVRGFADADVEPSFGSGELAAGQIVRGWVVFELPESARLISVLADPEVFGARITIARPGNSFCRWACPGAGPADLVYCIAINLCTCICKVVEHSPGGPFPQPCFSR